MQNGRLSFVFHVRQNHQQINIAVRARVAARPGAEEDDAQRIELERDAPDGFRQAFWLRDRVIRTWVFLAAYFTSFALP